MLVSAVLDGLPVIGAEKYDKLKTVLTRICSAHGNVREGPSPPRVAPLCSSNAAPSTRWRFGHATGAEALLHTQRLHQVCPLHARPAGITADPPLPPCRMLLDATAGGRLHKGLRLRGVLQARGAPLPPSPAWQCPPSAAPNAPVSPAAPCSRANNNPVQSVQALTICQQRSTWPYRPAAGALPAWGSSHGTSSHIEGRFIGGPTD